MRVTVAFNCRRTNSEEDAEFDTPDTINAIAEGLRASGHEPSLLEDLVQPVCPAAVSLNTMRQLHAATRTAKRALGIRDVGRADFRLAEGGRLYFLEMNALPSLDPEVGLFMATAREGYSYAQTLDAIVQSAAARGGIVARSPMVCSPAA